MSLISFDGFSTYANLGSGSAVGTAPLPSNFSYPSVLTPNDIANRPILVRAPGETRCWLASHGGSSVAANGAVVFSPSSGVPPTAGLGATGCPVFDLKQPLSTATKFVVGYKMRLANSGTWSFLPAPIHVLGAFMTSPYTGQPSDNLCVTVDQTAGANSQVAVYTTSASYQGGILTRDLIGVVGTSTFVFGNTLGTTQSLADVPVNTVEMELTASTLTVWINNVYVGSVNTNGAGTGIRYFKTGFGPQLVGQNASSVYYMHTAVSDFYALNGLGTTHTSRLGKVKVVTRLPASDASVTFTRPDTVNSNAEVAGQVPPKNSPALTGVKEGDTDLYAAPAFDFTNEAIIATSVNIAGFKTDPSGNDLAPVLSIGGTKYAGSAVTMPIGSSKIAVGQAIFAVNPKTGLAFTKSDLDSTNFGVKVAAPGT